MMDLNRLHRKRFAVGWLYDWFYIATPWFVARFADPAGAWDDCDCWCVRAVELWCGHRRDLRDGDRIWARCPRLVFWRLSLADARKAV